MSRKKKLIILKVSLLIIFVICCFILIRNNNGNKNNNVEILDSDIRENTLKMNNLEDLKVIGSKLKKNQNVTSIFLTVQNISDKELEYENIKIKTYDKDNNILLISYISGMNKLAANAEMKIEIKTDKDLSNASKYVVEKVEIE